MLDNTLILSENSSQETQKIEKSVKHVYLIAKENIH